MGLFENMRKLDELSLRLGTKQYTDGDIANLAGYLKQICDGKDANIVLGINAKTKGMRRTDYRKHRKISDAFKRVTAHMDSLTVGIDTNGNAVVFTSSKKELPMLKEAIIEVAEQCSMNPATLTTYWKNKKYKHLKDATA